MSTSLGAWWAPEVGACGGRLRWAPEVGACGGRLRWASEVGACWGRRGFGPQGRATLERVSWERFKGERTYALYLDQVYQMVGYYIRA